MSCLPSLNLKTERPVSTEFNESESTDGGLRNFREMQGVELEKAINKRRRVLAAKVKSDPKKQDKTYPTSDGDDLVGLALSGGGIRSAMFNLGLLQSMQRSGFLKHVDYISSVSGGGYTNGYYSTLGHYDATASKDDDHALSAKDAQFLLDGQYLNRPTEFMTDYLLKTAMLFGTVLAAVIFLASIIAIYFRTYDFPSVRRWLGLLDLKSDLQVGIFASVVLIIGVLLVRGLFRSLKRYFGATPSPSPGLWALIATGIMLLGCAIMIGNGDFYVSDKLGFLPEKIDLKSLQIPIAVIVAMLFFPLMRVGSLVRSEKITASIWQRFALRVILSGATWGSFFVAVGYLGQENLSGFITQRPPKLEKYDIIQYERFAGLLEGKELRNGIIETAIFKLETSGKRYTSEELEKLLEGIIREIQVAALTRNDLEKQLRTDDYEWDSWLDTNSMMLNRWANTFLGMTVCETDSCEYVNADTYLNEICGPKLLDVFNAAIRPASVDISEDWERETPEDVDTIMNSKPLCADRDLTAILMTLAARKAILRTKEIPQTVSNKLLNREIDPNCNASGDPTERENVRNEDLLPYAFEVLNRWVAQGSAMTRTSSSDPAGFRDASELKKLLGILAPVWVNPSSVSDSSDSNANNNHSLRTFERAMMQLKPMQHWTLNRLLLEVAYPDVFKETRWVSTSVTIHEDQRFRWAIMIASGIFAVIGILMVDINYLSPWFLFYRKRVHETFLRKAGQLDSEEPLHSLNPCEKGHPYPLFVGGLVLPHAPAYRHIQAAIIEGGSTSPSANINPSKVDGSFGSLWYSFLMSPLHVGWLQATTNSKLMDQKTYRCTKEYLHGGLTISDAIVLSGAAVSTFMASSLALRVLMQVFNIRLEQWLPNPINKRQPTKHLSLLFGGTKYVRFNTFQLFQEWFRSMRWSTQDFKNDSWRYGVVADGGFREFLGVEELIARRCKIIVASDAGCNNGLYEFGVLADLIRKLRLDHDVEILDLDHDKPLDTKRLVRIGSENSLSPQHYIVGRIKYPKSQQETNETPNDSPLKTPEEGLFVYVQMSLTGDEDIDIAQFKKTNPQFPDEPISNQFYSKDQVESFRQLGEHVGKLLCWDIDGFDCPTRDASKWRIETLDRGFREAYRSECRQESMVATDDARIGWMFDGPRPDKDVETIIKKFESPEETDHQILIRNFVWYCTDGYQCESGEDHAEYFDFDTLQAADLYGIAIEANRRHSGFRPEWPAAFFQVNGRDLLMRATQKAAVLLNQDDFMRKNLQQRLDLADPQTQQLIMEFSKLAVMLPRAVFRLEGVRTACDVLICLMNLGLKDNLPSTDEFLDEQKISKDLLLKMRCEPIQRKLRRAVQTGNPLEVETVLKDILLYHLFPPERKDNTLGMRLH